MPFKSNNAAQLANLIRSTDWLMDALALCRDSLPVEAFIGAGAIRNLVWDHLHSHASTPPFDIDVIYFDASVAYPADAAFERQLHGARPHLHWDVTNQAHVHTWYHGCFGKDVPPLHSVLEGLQSWPDTATAIAVRLNAQGDVDVLAPFGLDDLFDLVVRWNPARATQDDFTRRIASKQWRTRWPRLRILD